MAVFGTITFTKIMFVVEMKRKWPKKIENKENYMACIQVFIWHFAFQVFWCVAAFDTKTSDPCFLF